MRDEKKSWIGTPPREVEPCTYSGTSSLTLPQDMVTLTYTRRRIALTTDDPTHVRLFLLNHLRLVFCRLVLLMEGHQVIDIKMKHPITTCIYSSWIYNLGVRGLNLFTVYLCTGMNAQVTGRPRSILDTCNPTLNTHSCTASYSR